MPITPQLDRHYEPRNFSDRIAYAFIVLLRFFADTSCKKSGSRFAGFVVHNIVRINRQEFLVTTRDQIIWNIQCKNNLIDLDRVDSDANSFARGNRMLVRSYERALVAGRTPPLGRT